MLTLDTISMPSYLLGSKVEIEPTCAIPLDLELLPHVSGLVVDCAFTQIKYALKIRMEMVVRPLNQRRQWRPQCCRYAEMSVGVEQITFQAFLPFIPTSQSDGGSADSTCTR